MNELEARKKAKQLMEIAECCYLTTVDDQGFPQTRAMVNLRNSQLFPHLGHFYSKEKEEFLVYFSTNTSSKKILQIKQNPKASVYFSQPKEWRGLMLGGKVKIVTDNELKNSFWHESWLLYYPKGKEDPDFTLLCLKPDIGKYYERLKRIDFKLG